MAPATLSWTEPAPLNSGVRPATAVYRKILALGTAVTVKMPLYPAWVMPDTTTDDPTMNPWLAVVRIVTVVPIS